MDEEYLQLDVVDSLLKLFDDECLKCVVDRVLENNPDILSTKASLEEAGFNPTISRAALFPTLDFNSPTSRSKMAQASPINNFAFSFDAAWELDVWGGAAASVRASEADFERFRQDCENSKQSLAAQAMQAWMDLVEAEKLQDLEERRVESFGQTFRLVDRRFVAGIATLSEVELARTDSENAKASLEGARLTRDQAARRIRVLEGAYPDRNLSSLTWPSLSRTVPAGIPCGVLMRRPDILSAYQQIVVSEENVHVAYAELFPNFSLTASRGQSSSILENLFSSGASTWSIMGSMMAPLFDAGRRRAELGASKSRAVKAYHDYQSVLLTALEEVENALSAEQYLLRQEEFTKEALNAAERANVRARRDYEAGISEILNLLESQRSVFATEQQVINLRKSRLQNRISLALALGKGF